MLFDSSGNTPEWLDNFIDDFVQGYKAHQTSGNLVYDEVNYWTMGLLDSYNDVMNTEPFTAKNLKANFVLFMNVVPYTESARAGVGAWKTASSIKVYNGAGEVNGLRLSPKAKSYKDSGNITQALGEHYEDLIRNQMGGESKIIQGREFDAVTDTKIIQAKRSYTAIDNPDNFLKGATKRQIRETARIANELGIEAEYWFKYGVHPKVRNYIESKGIRVVEGLGK